MCHLFVSMNRSNCLYYILNKSVHNEHAMYLLLFTSTIFCNVCTFVLFFFGSRDVDIFIVNRCVCVWVCCSDCLSTVFSKHLFSGSSCRNEVTNRHNVLLEAGQVKCTSNVYLGLLCMWGAEKLNSCLELMRNILGENFAETTMMTSAIECDFNVEQSINQLLNQTHSCKTSSVDTSQG